METIINPLPIKITQSEYYKGRWDILNMDNIVIGFYFTKKSALNYSKRKNIPIELQCRGCYLSRMEVVQE